MKRILGLDLGTTSIGWAYIHEAENEQETSSIQKVGVRVTPLTTDEKSDFEKGKAITTNAGRTLARSARRNLQRYKLRREELLKLLKAHNLITDKTVLAENGKQTTFETVSLRAKAAKEQITLEDLTKVLLMINKKRGYKSSRKINNTEEGQLIDGMEVAKKLHHENLTPGQYSLQLLAQGAKKLPDYYRSDLEQEFERIWTVQASFYPELLTDAFKDTLKGKGQKATAATFWSTYGFNTAENKGTRDEKKYQSYVWREKALTEQLLQEEAAFVLADINGLIYNSSGYLGKISDRSKELYFNNFTVGEYLYNQLQENPHTRLKNQVFYRQDYIDEFDTIWTTQRHYYPTVLTDALKEEIRDIVIFYQRKLKSQKGLISFCELEQKKKLINGKEKTIGPRVIPKSSPLFQEFKIKQLLHNIELRNKQSKEVVTLTAEDKAFLFEELNLKGRMTAAEVLKLLVDKPKDWEINYSELEGNNTQEALYNAYLTILDLAGYDVREELKVKLKKDDITLKDLQVSAKDIHEMVQTIFTDLGISTELLTFDSTLEGKAFEQQAAYQLWHLLYAYVEDDSISGMEHLYQQLQDKFNFNYEQAKIIGNITLQDDYGNLSAKAIKNILPYLTDNNYSTACELGGYRHSKSSITSEENLARELKSKLAILPKNSLRNPVVEKILNQMINVVNALIDEENQKRVALGKAPNFQFDEIRVELARELKKNAKEREETTQAINRNKIAHEKIVTLLKKEHSLQNPSRNDIIRYKLYLELKNNGYKDLYTDKYIKASDIFTKMYDIEHIIPQSKLFDDSFSNKTLVPREVNLKKGNRTAYDFISEEYGQEALRMYLQRVQHLESYKEDGISKGKARKLSLKESEIGEGFIERDLRETQYIAKKAKALLLEITRNVLSTSGSITDKLRQDWDMINVMKELNFDKYQRAGLTEIIENRDQQKKEIITDWTKRNDHRHHAMDAITIAFTKPSHIQYLNHLNARSNDSDKLHAVIKNIENKEIDKNAKGNRTFKAPMPNFRQEVKKQLESILVSHKAKNKVVTRNVNKIQTKKGIKTQDTLTPRGQLHKETIYGKIMQYASKTEKIGPKFTAEVIQLVSNPNYKAALLQRLAENNQDPKKAFGGKNALNKTPLYLNTGKALVVPETVKLVWLEEEYTIRKDITPDLKLDKVIDSKVRSILQQRLAAYNQDAKLAFSDLDNNPIWLNKEKGIAIKRVTISGVKNALSLHTKKDHHGKPMLDAQGREIPVDFISTGNNHHVAIYEDEKGNLQEQVVSLFEAVIRRNQGVPIIDKTYNQHLGWKFLFSMKQNEMFLFPSETFHPEEIDLLDPKNKEDISKHLFRVQKFSKVEYGNSAVRDYVFRHHLETVLNDQKALKDVTYKSIKSLPGLAKIIKVRINHLGDIVHTGEY